MSRCECDWKWHKGQPCQQEAADHGSVRTSPELCIQCLYVCEGERDDEKAFRDRFMTGQHCPTCTCGKRAPVQRSREGGQKHGITYRPHGAGTIAWAEHEEAWAVYGARYSGQSAERIAERGGFGYGELVDLLHREPTTWRAAR